MKIVTGPVRSLWLNVFEPVLNERKNREVFSITFLIPKEDQYTLPLIREGIEVEIKNKWGERKPLELYLPLKDGDEYKRNDDYPMYKGNHYFYAWCYPDKAGYGPGIVDANGETLKYQHEFVSGDMCRVSFDLRAFETPVSSGLYAYLHNIQVLPGGSPFFSEPKKEASEEFGTWQANVKAGLEEWG